jgi:ankyrin repeat protein
MAKFLIESGAPVDAIQSPTAYGEATPLFFASRRGDPEMIRMLAAHGADVNARNECQNTPLTDCAGHANPETVCALLAVGANVNALGIYNLTALHQAVQSNRTETVRILLTAGADPIIRDQKGQTALDYATARRPSDPELVNLLRQAVSGQHSIGQAGRGGKDGIAKSPP